MAKSSAVPKLGQVAPDFELPDQDLKYRKLSEFRDKKTVLAFFPAAESSVCTAEMCALRDSLDELRDYGANVVAVSVDGPFANKAFANNHHLNFPVLSDHNKKVIQKYGIVMKGLALMSDYKAAKRSIFILDKNGKVRYKWVSDNPGVEPKYAEIKNFLQSSQSA